MNVCMTPSGDEFVSYSHYTLVHTIENDVQVKSNEMFDALQCSFPSFQRNKHLVSLKFSQLTPLSLVDKKIIIQSFIEHANVDALTIYDLMHNRETTRQEWFQLFVKHLINSTILRQLKLKNEWFGDSEATGLAEVLRTNKSITKLEITSTSITEVGITEIAHALRENVTLTYLDLSCNSYIGNGHIEIAKMMTCNKKIETLLLNETITNNRRNHEICTWRQEIAKMISVNTTLHHFELGAAFVGNVAWDGSSTNALLRALSINVSLRRISIRGARLTDMKGNFPHVLFGNTRIEHINLSNFCSLRNCDILKSMLPNKTIRSLNLSNLFQTDSFFSCMEMVRTCARLIQNNPIEYIDLSHNSIEDEGALLIADVLRTNTSLRQLCLSFNKITIRGVTAIMTSLENNYSLHTLHLKQIRIDEDEFRKLAPVFEANTQLIRFTVSSYSNGIETSLFNSHEIAERNCRRRLKNERAIVARMHTLPDELKRHIMEYFIIAI